MDTRRFWAFLGLAFMLLWLSACSGAPAREPAAEEPAAETVVEEPAEEEPAAEEIHPTATPPPQPTAALTSPTPAPTRFIPTPTAVIEPRVVEVEWPERMRLGDSDVIRLALIPTKNGYAVTTEFPDHQTITQDVPVVRPEGYELYGVGQLHGVGFLISPTGDQVRSLPLDESVVWHWSLTPEQPGRQRITVTLLLRWVPLEGTASPVREAVAYSRGLEVRVTSFFGLTRGQAMTTGLFGAIFGGGLSLFALAYRPGAREGEYPGVAASLSSRAPNRELVIECPSGVRLSPEEEALLRSLFSRYGRLVIQSEFLSGYSGARTFLLLPVRTDGRSDAHTIAKLGDRDSIQREYRNYQAFVKHTLPPVTARIQNPPVITPHLTGSAALQYTFIGEAGSKPTSLRQALLENPNPALLDKLFETFGPNWWMQRRPYAFRLGQEYDRMLPPHYVLEPEAGKGQTLEAGSPPGEIRLSAGDRVSLRNFSRSERRADGQTYAIRGETAPGHPRLNLRWMGTELPRNPTGRVVATRQDLLRSYVAGFDVFGLPDPLEKLPVLLDENVTGTRSIIHGDLNLENVLIGPGGFVWLIDFATTREGHPLADFAHLEAEVIAHILAPQIDDPAEFIETFDNEHSKFYILRKTLHEIAAKCLSNPSQPREYHLALYVSCLGALKYRNLTPHQKHFLYLTAARLVARL